MDAGPKGRAPNEGDEARAHRARSVLDHITRASHLLVRLSNLVAAQAELTGPSWVLLASVVHSGEEGLPLGALARASGLSAPNITARVRRLEQAGLVSRTRDEHDRRIVRVRPTKTAAERLARLEKPADAVAHGLFDSFGDAELEHFEALSRRLLQRLEGVEVGASSEGVDAWLERWTR